jgi:hypothetical protein
MADCCASSEADDRYDLVVVGAGSAGRTAPGSRVSQELDPGYSPSTPKSVSNTASSFREPCVQSA